MTAAITFITPVGNTCKSILPVEPNAVMFLSGVCCVAWLTLRIADSAEVCFGDLFQAFLKMALAGGAAKSVHVTVVRPRRGKQLGHYGIDGN